MPRFNVVIRLTIKQCNILEQIACALQVLSIKSKIESRKSIKSTNERKRSKMMPNERWEKTIYSTKHPICSRQSRNKRDTFLYRASIISIKNVYYCCTFFLIDQAKKQISKKHDQCTKQDPIFPITLCVKSKWHDLPTEHKYKVQ